MQPKHRQEIPLRNDWAAPYKVRYPWATMEINDSFEPLTLTTEDSIRTRASSAGKKLGRTFSVRRIAKATVTSTGLRVWRLA